MQIDIEKCERAMRHIYVRGLCNTARREGLIEKAIGLIQEDPQGALQSEYIGMKNYAGFGDQEISCGYGYGPRHGSVVFSIGRAREQRPALGEDHIYFLECVRDFEGIELGDEKSATLPSAIYAMRSAETTAAEIYGKLFGVNIKRDGNVWCATNPDFINLQESKAGFGLSPAVAFSELQEA